MGDMTLREFTFTVLGMIVIIAGVSMLLGIFIVASWHKQKPTPEFRRRHDIK